jgi:hypothetical protein
MRDKRSQIGQVGDGPLDCRCIQVASLDSAFAKLLASLS